MSTAFEVIAANLRVAFWSVHIETTTFERAIHLALFIVGGIAFGVGALAVLERLTGAGPRTIRPAYVIASAAAFVALALAEAGFHLMR